ncbi:heat shock protein, Hsp20 family [Coxiella-like endosymbiont]|uniref:Hsp20/alpha crystallin family protein n=1 Tax=Coxiella-like endosymbiont TaxID=1592897 RepID=UPI000C80C67B|nr:Hsp20/alpha crystallin family protein [Coxiella-like endosymbiont]PMB55015.1 heat shock protein, Hsp20 family [Coxiella-like endosymbiont]
MANIQKHPQSLLSQLQEDINRLFEPFGWSTENQLGDAFSREWSPRIDIKDMNDNYLIRADIPGVDPKAIEISIENNVLTIRGEKETETQEKKEDFLRVERTKGAFIRRFSLPESVNAERIKAKTKHGVLEILIPKMKRSGVQKIQIEDENNH